MIQVGDVVRFKPKCVEGTPVIATWRYLVLSIIPCSIRGIAGPRQITVRDISNGLTLDLYEIALEAVNLIEGMHDCYMNLKDGETDAASR